MRPATQKRPALAAMLLLLIVLGSGCSDRTASVSGVVKLDDAPLAIAARQRGMVVFRPVAGGATCTSLIDGSGRYSVATGSDTGVVPGDYMVSVRVIELVDGEAGEGASGRPITPALYADPLTSGLLYSVQSGSNKIDIALDSGAGPAVLPTPPPTDEPPADEPPADADKSDAEPAVEPAPDQQDQDAADAAQPNREKPAPVASPELKEASDVQE